MRPKLSGPLSARMMNQAKERRISLTQSGMRSSRNSVGTTLGLRDLGQIVGQRIGDHEAEERDEAAVEDRPKEDVDMDRALEEGQIVVEAVDILGPADLDDRQIGPEGILEQIEIGQDHQRQQPEGRQRHESGRQRPAVAGEEIPHAEAPRPGPFRPPGRSACAGSKTIFMLLPGGGTSPAPSLRASTTRGRPSPFGPGY